MLSPEGHRQAVLDRYQAERRLPTLLCTVLVPAGVDWTGCAGTTVATDTQFRIGSITKTVTAMLVLGARDDGLLELEDPVARYLPGHGYGYVSLRSLLAHTSGMQSEPAGEWWERSPGMTTAQLLAGNDGTAAVAPRGKRYHYSNLGYALLGEVVARVRGRPWFEVVRSEVLDPLGMSRTTYLPQAPVTQGYSVDHLSGHLTAEPAYDTRAMAPAGQLWSTVHDLGLLARHLASPALAEMRQPVAPALDYGLGVRLVPHSAGVLVGHAGSMPGFQAAMMIDPLSGDGLVAVTNGTTGFNGPELALAVLGASTPAPIEPWVPTVQVPTWAEELLGWWFWGNSVYELRWNNERLEFRDLARCVVAEQFELSSGAGPGEVRGRIVGVAGYHHGETLHMHRDPDGSVSHLECATFRYTRTPYPKRGPAGQSA